MSKNAFNKIAAGLTEALGQVRGPFYVEQDQRNQWVVYKKSGDPVAWYQTETEARAFADGATYSLENARLDI